MAKGLNWEAAKHRDLGKAARSKKAEDDSKPLPTRKITEAQRRYIEHLAQ